MLPERLSECRTGAAGGPGNGPAFSMDLSARPLLPACVRNGFVLS